jgi:hypothetical protein
MAGLMLSNIEIKKDILADENINTCSVWRK